MHEAVHQGSSANQGWKSGDESNVSLYITSYHVVFASLLFSGFKALSQPSFCKLIRTPVQARQNTHYTLSVDTESAIKLTRLKCFSFREAHYWGSFTIEKVVL